MPISLLTISHYYKLLRDGNPTIKNPTYDRFGLLFIVGRVFQLLLRHAIDEFYTRKNHGTDPSAMRLGPAGKAVVGCFFLCRKPF